MTVYVEGGGDTRRQQASARKAFKTLFERAHLKGRMPAVVACGGRSQAIRDFGVAAKRGEAAALLVDSEGPVAPGVSAVGHLQTRGEWNGASHDERIHLMVRVMETWFLTQPEVLVAFFGKNFNASALPGQRNIETISKEQVFDSLDKATTACPSGSYTAHKIKGFEILERLQVEKIELASPFAKQFFEFLRSATPRPE